MICPPRGWIARTIDQPAPAIPAGLRISGARRLTITEYSETENADDPPWPNTPMR